MFTGCPLIELSRAGGLGERTTRHPHHQSVGGIHHAVHVYPIGTNTEQRNGGAFDDEERRLGPGTVDGIHLVTPSVQVTFVAKSVQDLIHGAGPVHDRHVGPVESRR
jgi:hypothetical protein